MTRRGARSGFDDAPDFEDAVGKYVEFHRHDPKRIGGFPGGTLHIPKTVHKLGRGKHVLYRSDKVDPETLRRPRAPQNYIHEHDAGVDLYDTRRGGTASVPDWIVNVDGLVLLGTCLGIAWMEGDEVCEADGTTPLPELYTIPSGRALLVVQSKRTVLALAWGGALGVEARGIVG